MEKSEKIDTIAKALIKFQTDLRPVKADQRNTFYDSRYASLTAMKAAVADGLAAHGLCVVQCFNPEHGTGEIGITTLLLHQSGQFLAGTQRIPVTKDSPSAIGAAASHGRRLGFAAILGLVTEDSVAEGEAPDPKNYTHAAPVPVPARSAGGQKPPSAAQISRVKTILAGRPNPLQTINTILKKRGQPLASAVDTLTGSQAWHIINDQSEGNGHTP